MRRSGGDERRRSGRTRVLAPEPFAKGSRGVGVGPAVAVGIVLLDRRLDPGVKRDGLVEVQREEEYAVGHLVADADEPRQVLPCVLVRKIARPRPDDPRRWRPSRRSGRRRERGIPNRARGVQPRSRSRAVPASETRDTSRRRNRSRRRTRGPASRPSCESVRRASGPSR